MFVSLSSDRRSVDGFHPMGEEELFLLGKKVLGGAEKGAESGRHLEGHGEKDEKPEMDLPRGAAPLGKFTQKAASE